MTDTYAANQLLRVGFAGDLEHPLAVFKPTLISRAVVYPLTFPLMQPNGLVRGTQSLFSTWMIADQYLGPLPLVGLDQHAARAIAENWTSDVRASRLDPLKPDQVLKWADRLHERAPTRAKLPHQVQWPPGLLLSKFITDPTT